MINSTTKKGVFVVSIDYEFAWGYVDRNISETQKQSIKKEVEITRRLIALFEKYNIPATWAIVSKLLDPGTDVLWSDTEKLIPKIRDSVVGHEIGSHSYSHVIYGDNKTSFDIKIDDLSKAKMVHAANGLDFKSFIFPRNSEGCHKDLVNAGLNCFRAKKSNSFYFLPNFLLRIINISSYFLPTAVVGFPKNHTSGLIEIPSGMLLIGRNGIRKLISPRFLIRKAERSLQAASLEGKIFHLWFHPSNFAYDTEIQFAILEEILRKADLLRNKGNIQIKTMNQISTDFKSNKILPIDKAVESHHLNSSVFFNRYKIFDQNPYSNAFTYDRKRLFSFLLGFFNKNFNKGAKILEVGSGTGYFLNLLKKMNFDVTGVEPATGMRDLALSEYPDLKIIRAGVEKLPFEDHSFDVVVAIEVFRYLNASEQESGYRECLRVLKPGGTLVVTLVNKYALDLFYFKYKFFALLEKLGIKELPNYCDFKTPNSIGKFLKSRLALSDIKIETTGVLFAPIRLIYKISRNLGEIVSKKIEKFDESLTYKKIHKKFAGYLVLIVTK